MVDLNYIRKRKIRRIIAIVGSISAAAVAAIMAVALLGTRAAPLTVKLANSGASLALFKSDFDNEHKSFLLAGDTKPYTDVTEPRLNSYQSLLDIDDSKSIETSDGQSIQFFQYTFYLTNAGDNSAQYSLSLNISYPSKSSFDLADVLRVRFYENDANDKESHNYRTFAKHGKFNQETGDYDPERIAGSGTEFAEKFESASNAFTHTVESFAPGASVRYTFVLWLEGEDPDCTGKAPLDSSIALGVNISAHAAEEATV